MPEIEPTIRQRPRPGGFVRRLVFVSLAPNDPTIQDVIQPSNLLFGMYAATNDARYLKAMSSTRQTSTTS